MSDAPSAALQEAMPPHEVVPLRHPWTWAASAVVGLIAIAALISVATNPAFEWPVVAQYLFDEQILLGLSRTLELTVVAMAMGLGIGTLLAVMRLSSNPLLSTVSWLYIWFFRSVPVLVQLIFWYNFGALYAHITLRIPFGPVLFSANTNNLITPLFAALAGLGLAQAAYTAEVIRGGIVSVPRGQTRAALALGMRPATIFWRIVFPQAMKVIIPPVGNEVISMVKNTSLVSVIALAELLYTAQLIYARTYETIPLLIVASLWYLAIVSILSVAQHFLERRYRQRT
jgi:polar amino acid transport system permease protein